MEFRNLVTGCLVFGAVGVMSPFIGDAKAATIIDTVPGSRSLYHDDWGHPFDVSGGGSELDALGRGDPAVAFGGGFAFSSGQEISITASDCVVDDGSSCTGPDGFSSLFRGLPVYSLIGVWSSDPTEILPVEAGPNPAFFIGSALDLIVPTSPGDLYLFLGDNDGTFSDNPSRFAYTVAIDVSMPEPSTLLGLGTLALASGLLLKRDRTS